MMNKAIVETTFQAQWPNGRLQKITVRIGRPIQAKTQEWICSIQIVGLQKTTRVRGEDALQALCLGVHLIGDLLYDFRKKGIRPSFITTLEEVPLYAYFRIKDFQRRMKKQGRKRVSFGKR
jgi:hypothetical protein